MLTTLVENWPGFRDGIMGPDLMAEMRAQAERFGAEIIRGQRDRPVDLLASNPFVVTTVRRRMRYQCRALIIATGASARLLGLPSERALIGHGVSTCATCDGYFFRGQADRGRRRRRFGDGRSDLPDALRLARHRRPPPRHAARVEDHAGQGVRQPEDLVRVEHRGRRDQRPGRKGEVTAMVAAQQRDRASARSSPVDGVFVAIGHTPNTQLVRRPARDRSGTATSSRTPARAPACPASSPAATSRITSTGRRSPPPAPAAWRRSTRRSISKACRST